VGGIIEGVIVVVIVSVGVVGGGVIVPIVGVIIVVFMGVVIGGGIVVSIGVGGTILVVGGVIARDVGGEIVPVGGRIVSTGGMVLVGRVVVVRDGNAIPGGMAAMRAMASGARGPERASPGVRYRSTSRSWR
jgi:hypothetical protein